MKTKEKAIIKQRIIPELVSGSSTHAVTQQQASKTLKKFQGLSYFISEHGFTHKAYRLGVSPTGATNKRWDTYHMAGNLSGSHPTYKRTYKEEALNKGSFRAPLRSGFTLIELLVVVLIIGILAAVALPQYQAAVTKAKVVRLLPLLRSIELAEQRYFLENGSYTQDFTALDIEMPGGYTHSWNTNGKLANLQYDGFMCNLAETSVKCRLNNDMILEKNYSQNYIECWANPNNSLYNRVCKSLSGKDFVGTYNPGNKYLISM